MDSSTVGSTGLVLFLCLSVECKLKLCLTLLREREREKEKDGKMVLSNVQMKQEKPRLVLSPTFSAIPKELK